MLPEFLERRFCLANADRRLMTAAPLVGDAARDYENCRLVRDGRIERIDLKVIFRSFATEECVGELTCGYVFHVKHCTIHSTVV